MVDMNINARYKEIAKISGTSENIVRAVLSACQQSVTKSLQGGNEATLPGLVTFRPEVKSKFDINTQDIQKYIDVKAKTSKSLISLIRDPNRNNYVSEGKDVVEDLEYNLTYMSDDDIEAKNTGIRLRQIDSLT